MELTMHALKFTAARNIVMNASGNISTGSMENTTLLAGKKIGLFAHTGKLSLISNEGPVDIKT